MNKPVTVTPDESCVTYALKRGGYNIPIEPSDYVGEGFDEWVDRYFQRIPYAKVPPGEIQEGDILYWKAKEQAFIPVTIDEAGGLLYERRWIKRHFAIVESRGRYSDITRTMVNLQVTINVAALGTFTRGNPDYILKLKIQC